MKHAIRRLTIIFALIIHVPVAFSSLSVAKKSISNNINQTTKFLHNSLQNSQDNLLSKHSTAIHEAGHALLYTLFGDSINTATIEFADKNLKKMSSLTALKKSITRQPIVGGYVQSGSQHLILNDMPAHTSEQEKIEIKNYRSLQNCYIETIISLGGIIAEQIFGAYSDLVPRDLAKMIYSDKRAKKRKDILKISSNSHGQGDLKNIHKNLSKYFDTKEFDTIIEQCYTITYKILRAHKKELEMIADLLFKKRTLSGDQINQLLKLPQTTELSISSEIYAKELTQTYPTIQDYIDGRFLVTDAKKDFYSGYYVTTPPSIIHPKLTGLKIKIYTIYSNEYLENRKLLTKK